MEPVEQAPLQTGTERILFVDDEEFMGDLGKQILERLGYRVETRTSSIEALALFKEKPDSFDLIITDLNMPNLTGYELAKRLLEIRKNIPIIMCTGFSESITEDKALAIGIKAYAMKPLVVSEIANTIREVLGKN